MDLDRLAGVMEQIKSSHARLMRTLHGLRDGDVKEPSLLPDWTRGHVLAHIARNADSHVRLLTAAARGESVEQYEGGKEGRAADIDAGAGLSAADLIDDVATSAQRLFETWSKVPGRVWDEEVIAIHGGQPAWTCVYSRWREYEIHHVDLGLGYTIDDWPQDFVATTLAHLAPTLADRTDLALEIAATDMDFTATMRPDEKDADRTVEAPGRVLLAWMSGRPLPPGTNLPELGPWL